MNYSIALIRWNTVIDSTVIDITMIGGIWSFMYRLDVEIEFVIPIANYLLC